MNPEEVEKQRKKVENKLNDLTLEINEFTSKKNHIIELLTAIYISLFFWIVSGFQISGNQIISACLLIFLLWCIYYLLFYVIRAYKNMSVSVEDKFTTYINLEQEKREDIHDAINKLTPHFSKRAYHSVIMTIIMFVCIIIIFLSSHFISNISINLFNTNRIIMILLFVIILGKLIIVIQPNRSLNYFHKGEIRAESFFRDEKIKKIASSKKVQKFAVFIMTLIGSLPSLFCIGSTIYLFYKHQDLFNLSLPIIIVILVVLLISSYLMQCYSNIVAQLSLGNEIRNSLYDLRERIDQRKIRSIEKIQDEFNEILYTKLKF